MRVFCIVEVVVLILGLGRRAASGRSRAPALFPLRMLASVYTDVFRGIPTILLVYLVGFGIPALGAQRAADRAGRARRDRADALLRRLRQRGLPRRARIRPPGQRDAALGDRAHRAPGDALRDPAAGGAARRPAAAQRLHRAAEGRRADRDHRGRGEAFRVAQIDAASNFNYTPLVAAALLYLAVTIPLARLLDRWERGQRAARLTRRRSSRSAASPRRSASARCCTASTSRSHEHEAVALIGASGSGKSTLLRCVDLLEEIDDGDIFLDGEVITDPSVDPVAVRRRLGLVFQAYNLFPHLTVLENVVLGATAPTACRAPRPRRRARALLERFGLGGPRGRPPGRALRRPAAAGRAGPRVRRPAAGAAARRGHQRARPRAGRRGARGRARPEGRGRDDADRDPRDGLRPRGRRQGLLPARGRIVERGAPEQVLGAPQQPETKRFLRRLLEAGRL